jgi:hypothetical protein
MDDNTTIQLSRGEMKSLMEEAVNNAFTKMGMDVSDPIEMQRDFQHLRDWRIAVKSAQSKGFLTIIGLLTAGVVAALWIGFKAVVTAP